MITPQILIALGLFFLNSIVTIIAVLTFTRGLATKDDIGRLDKRIDNLRAELKSGISDLRAELHTEIDNLRAELKSGISDLRVEIHTEIRDLRTDIKQLNQHLIEYLKDRS